jgi:primosomal protein N' (replication factor Y)
VYDGNNGIFSRKFLQKLAECMERNEQAIIFINRRGYTSYVICRSCGYVAKCEQCDVSLVYHKEDNALKCHYCGNRYAPLKACPQCGAMMNPDAKSEHAKCEYCGYYIIIEKGSIVWE